jgi:hypothetical protein
MTMSDNIKLPNLVQIQLPPQLRDRWLTIGEGLDQVQGIKFEKFSDDLYQLLVVLPDGTGDPIQWPGEHTTFAEAEREAK